MVTLPKQNRPAMTVEIDTPNARPEVNGGTFDAHIMKIRIVDWLLRDAS